MNKFGVVVKNIAAPNFLLFTAIFLKNLIFSLAVSLVIGLYKIVNQSNRNRIFFLDFPYSHIFV